jgi:hypothetical protein
LISAENWAIAGAERAGQLGDLGAAVHRLHQREVVAAGELRQVLEALEPDPARRHVEARRRREVVLRRDDHLEVGEDVLDLLLVVKRLPAEHAVGDAVLLQQRLDRVALARRPVQHRDVLGASRPARG